MIKTTFPFEFQCLFLWKSNNFKNVVKIYNEIPLVLLSAVVTSMAFSCYTDNCWNFDWTQSYILNCPLKPCTGSLSLIKGDHFEPVYLNFIILQLQVTYKFTSKGHLDKMGKQSHLTDWNYNSSSLSNSLGKNINSLLTQQKCIFVSD